MRSLVCLALAFFLVFAATAEKRAFIVGVGEYQNLSDLQKTTGDADGYSDLFGDDLDFEVTKLINPTQLEFVGAFGSFLETVNAGDEIVFVFSGHGWTDNAENYLVMADAPLEASQFALKSQTVPLSTVVLSELKRKNPQLVLAIIDACRENPFDGMTRGLVPVGLVPVQAPEGMLLMFAAGDRQLALDRLSARDASPYSVFTRTLLPMLRDAERPLQDIARDVKDDVRDLAMTIQHDQRPAYYDELLGDYCLSGKCIPRLSEDDPEMQLWISASTAVAQDRCAGLIEYVRAYPDGAYSVDANQMITDELCAEEFSGFWQYQSEFQQKYNQAADYLALADKDYADGYKKGALDRYYPVIDLHQKYNLFPGRDEVLRAYARSIEITLETGDEDYHSLDELIAGLRQEVNHRAEQAGFVKDSFESNRVRMNEIPYAGDMIYYDLLIDLNQSGYKPFRKRFCREEEFQTDRDSNSFGMFRIDEPVLSKLREIRSSVNCTPQHFDFEMSAAIELVALAKESGDQESFEHAMEYLNYFADLMLTESDVARPSTVLVPFTELAIAIGDLRIDRGRLTDIDSRKFGRNLTRLLNGELSARGYTVNDHLPDLVSGEEAFFASLQLELLEMNVHERRAVTCESEWMVDVNKGRFGPVKIREPWLSAAREWRKTWGCGAE